MAVLPRSFLVNSFTTGKSVIEQSLSNFIDSNLCIISNTEQVVTTEVCAVSVSALEMSTSYLAASSARSGNANTNRMTINGSINLSKQEIAVSSKMTADIALTSANFVLSSLNGMRQIVRNDGNATVSATPASATLRIDSLATGAAYSLSAKTTKIFYYLGSISKYVTQ